ncbi:MAG TPA: glycosyltransferase family 2 protein [Nitrososphaeraceae archaeon]
MDSSLDLQLLPITLALGIIMTAILGTWVYLMLYSLRSFRRSPVLGKAVRQRPYTFPKISVIVPALNEEKYIARCLDSLLAQDYPNFEIIAVDDSSIDKTGKIMDNYSKNETRIIVIHSDPAPEGWVGKNWACFQGYVRSSGDILLFTDADTIHSPQLMTSATTALVMGQLKALTVIPRLVCNEIWTRITVPVLSIFLHTRFSALRVNDPNTRVGYFFGSFFLITRQTYEKVGTHASVRQELVEDGALGSKVKQGKFEMKMFRGESEIQAVWARDMNTLWNGLRRLVIPMYSQHKNQTILLTIALFFLLIGPFIVLPYSLFLVINAIKLVNILDFILFASNLGSIVLIIITDAVQLKFGIGEKSIYALASPIGGAVISASFISSNLDANKQNAVNWRGRGYTVKRDQHPIS